MLAVIIRAISLLNILCQGDRLVIMANGSLVEEEPPVTEVFNLSFSSFNSTVMAGYLDGGGVMDYACTQVLHRF